MSNDESRVVVERRPTAEESRLIQQHARQRIVATLTSPLWVMLTIGWMRFIRRYRVADIGAIRAQYQEIRAQSVAPMLICANHLTLVDSLIVAWALGSGGYWLRHPDELPWNTPERTNFGTNRIALFLLFICKCILITRGGSREDVAAVLGRVRLLLTNRETALIFPEAGRSRSGRVDEDAGAWGVGRVIGNVPGCRVLCVYLRGRKQQTWGDYPVVGDVLDVSLMCIEPKSDAKGVRRSRDLARQVTKQLARMEGDYFDARK